MYFTVASYGCVMLVIKVEEKRCVETSAWKMSLCDIRNVESHKGMYLACIHLDSKER